ncbi:hypothetical protein LCGC14_0194970 [marine sediment metagenome]|uniref:Uncharacterized protein n=1 Tax=marine sediment metagenome TaxID=412755 RepID=A0A0F9UK84_9ZZZZ
MTVEAISEPLYKIVLKKSQIEANGISPLFKGLALDNLEIVEGYSYMDKEEFVHKFRRSIVHNTKTDAIDPKTGKKPYKNHMYFNPCPDSVGRFQRRDGKWIYPNGHRNCIVPRRMYRAVIVTRLAPQFREMLNKGEFKGLREAYINPLVKVARILPMLIRHADPVIYRRPNDFTFIPGFEAIECKKHYGFKKKINLTHMLKYDQNLGEEERTFIDDELKKLPKILKCDAKCTSFKNVKSSERNFLNKLAQSPNTPDAWVDPEIKDIFSISIYY